MENDPTDPRPFIGIHQGECVNEQPAGIAADQGNLRCRQMIGHVAEGDHREDEQQTAIGLIIDHLANTRQNQGDRQDQIGMEGRLGGRLLGSRIPHQIGFIVCFIDLLHHAARIFPRREPSPTLAMMCEFAAGNQGKFNKYP